MPRNLAPMRDLERARGFGVRQSFTESDVVESVLHSGTYTDIMTNTSTESAKYFMGHGANSRNDANAGYFYIDLTATGDGALSADDEVNGTYRFIVYEDSEDEVPVVGPTYDSVDLREAEGDARTERPVLPLLVPGAGKDKKIAVQLNVDSDSNGAEVDGAQTNDNLIVPYTQVLQ